MCSVVTELLQEKTENNVQYSDINKILDLDCERYNYKMYVSMWVNRGLVYAFMCNFDQVNEISYF